MVLVNSSRAAIALIAVMLTVCTAYRASAAEGQAGAADIQVMVFPSVMFPALPGQVGGEDRVTFTYSAAVSDAQAMKDFLAYSKITSRTLHDVQVSTDRTPLSGVQSPKMTCVTFTTADVIRSTVPYFDLSPFIETMKAYRHQRLIFVTPNGFQFSGLRTYKDRNVDITLDQMSAHGGTTFTYNVNVIDSNFQSLHLPTWQADPAVLKVAQQKKADQRLLLIKVLGVVLIGGAASLIGYFVYSVLAAKGPA